MSVFNTSQMALVEHFLDLLTVRQSLLVSNIANVDTPGYRTKDIDFRKEFEKAVNESPEQATLPVAREVSGLLSRPDGNNVSVDREGLLLAELQLKYQAAANSMKAEFQYLRMAIREGGQ
jgi:flagellar basal-body rod protein FlgB